MKSKIFLTLLLALSSLAACAVPNPTATSEDRNIVSENPPPVGEKSPVLIELFTSEG